MKHTIIVFLLGLITITACYKERECGGGITTLGTLYLLPSSREVFPYETGIKAIEFTDSQGQTDNYEVVQDTLRFFPSVFDSKCGDKEKYYPYTAGEENRIVEIYSKAADRRFKVQLYTGLDREFANQLLLADYMRVDLGVPPSQSNTNAWEWEALLRLVIDPRTDPEAESDPTNFYPKLELNGQTFYQVYEKEMDASADVSRIYFNFEFGLIGFTNSKDGNSYSFDQIIY
ncbi:MAG: hypothetical protein R2824_28775 [Saprospiraceae bacterium]